MFDLFRLVLRELSDTPCSSFRHVFPGRDFYLGAEWERAFQRSLLCSQFGNRWLLIPRAFASP
jgi:hypothetical protein